MGCPTFPDASRPATRAPRLNSLIREAIDVHIESLREHGEPVPEPSSTVGMVSGSKVVMARALVPYSDGKRIGRHREAEVKRELEGGCVAGTRERRDDSWLGGF